MIIYMTVRMRTTNRLFADTAAILKLIYGMLMAQMHATWSLDHPIMSLKSIELKTAAVSVKGFLYNPWNLKWLIFTRK